jgi:hypothetical protein
MVATESSPEPQGEGVEVPGASGQPVAEVVTPEVVTCLPRLPADDPLVCRVCGWKAASKGGLTRHKNVSGPNHLPPKSHKRRIETAADAYRAGKDALEEISDGKVTPPSIDELNRALARLVNTGTMAAASYVCETDPRLRSDLEIDEAVEDLTLTGTEAQQVTFPVARMIGRSKVNKRYGRTIVENVEVGESLAVLVSVTLRWRRYMGGRREAIRSERPLPPPIRLADTEGNLATHGSGQSVAPDGIPSGQLATPEMVEQIRRQREAS